MSSERKTKRIHIRISERDLDNIRRNAASAGMSLTDYLLDSGLRNCEVKYISDYDDLSRFMNEIQDSLLTLRSVIPVIVESGGATRKDLDMITEAVNRLACDLDEHLRMYRLERNKIFGDAKKAIYNDARRTRRHYPNAENDTGTRDKKQALY